MRVRTGEKDFKFFLPLFNVSLQTQDEMDLGFGFRIMKIKEPYSEMLKYIRKLYPMYETGIQKLTIGLQFQPAANHPIQPIVEQEGFLFERTQYYCIFTAFLLRLLTGIPMDFPFWLWSTENGSAHGHTSTLIRTYWNDPDYIYPIDTNECNDAINLFRENIEELLRRQAGYSGRSYAQDRLIRAIEFASFAYQTCHIMPRFVNIVTFMEILFTTSRTEITHQLSEGIAWYIEPNNDTARLDLYGLIKRLYDQRSTIVHGEHLRKKEDLRQLLQKAENLSTQIFKAILRNKHIGAFTNEKERKSELKKLALGMPCAFRQPLL